MIQIKIQEQNYDIPTEWRDMTLRYWCGLYNVMNKHTQRDEDGVIIDEEQSEVETLKINRDIFMYITGLNKNTMANLDVDSVTNAVNTFAGAITEYKPLGVDQFKQDGKIYYFPSEFLKTSSFGDYIETTHLESTVKIMKHGRFDILPEQMAILCREAGEEYDDDVIPIKTEKFKELSMDKVWEFAFFLTQRSVKLTKTFQMFLGKTEKELEVEKIKFLQLDSTTSL